MRCLERSTATFESQPPFELTHFAPEHFVVDAVRTGERDVANVDAIARIDEERERDFVRLVVRRRHRVDLREGITVGAESVLNAAPASS